MAASLRPSCVLGVDATKTDPDAPQIPKTYLLKPDDLVNAKKAYQNKWSSLEDELVWSIESYKRKYGVFVWTWAWACERACARMCVLDCTLTEYAHVLRGGMCTRASFIPFPPGARTHTQTHTRTRTHAHTHTNPFQLFSADDYRSMGCPSITVTKQGFTPPSGDKRDYMSLAFYGHPCTQAPCGSGSNCDKATGLPWVCECVCAYISLLYACVCV